MKRNIFAFVLALILTLGAFSGCSSPGATNADSISPLKIFSAQGEGLFLGDDGKLWGYGMNVIGNSDKTELTARQQQEIPPVIAQYVTEEDDIPVIYNLHLLAENVKDFNFNSYLLILCEDGTLYDYEGRRFGTNSSEKLVPVYSGVEKLCGDSQYSFILEDGTLISTAYKEYDTKNYTDCYGLSDQKMSKFKYKVKMMYDNAYIDLKDNLWVRGYNSYGWHGNGKQDFVTLEEYSKSQTKPEYDLFEYHKVMSDVNSFSSVSLVLGVALKNDGSLWTWGSNEYGTVGNGEMGDGYPNVRESVTKPYKVLDNVVEAFPSRRNTIIGFSYAEQTVVALTADGDVYTWGANREGLVGNGEVAQTDDLKLGSVAAPTKILSGVKDIAKIYGYTGGTFYALKENGELYAWGNSVCGEVGNGVKMECFDRNKVMDRVYRVGAPALVATDIVYFDGFMAPYAIDKNGTVYAWGTAPFGYGGYGASRELEASIPGYGSNKMYLAKPVVHPQLSATISADGTVSFVPTPIE